jgi:hypothetical protein
LAFHHLDTSKKERNISELAPGWSIDRILKEIAKCKVLCHNCHTKVHAGILSLEGEGMQINPDTTHLLVQEGYCISSSMARKIQCQIPDAEALEEWKRKQKKSNEVV